MTKRTDLATNIQYEVLFTEAAYDAYKKDPNYQDKVTVRLKTNYRTIDDFWPKVFLMRMPEEHNVSTLRYHSEAWYEYRDNLQQ